MPGVKKLFQESENSVKPEYIHGHMFDELGILAGDARKWACSPLNIRLHAGLLATMGWKNAPVSKPPEMAFVSHVVQMVEDAYQVALTFGDSLLLLDRYFLTIPALEKRNTLNGDEKVRLALSCISMGILQSISIGFIEEMDASQFCYQRTPSKERVSETTLMDYFRKHFFCLLGKRPELCIT